MGGSLDDNLVACVGHSVQGLVAQEKAVEWGKLFLHGPVGCDEEAGAPVKSDKELVRVSRLLVGEAAEAQVI